MPKRKAMRRPRARRSAAVLDLDAARLERRRQVAERRVRAVLEENRAALGRLFATGLIFTHKGSRSARDLLGAHQALLKIVDLFARMDESAAPPLQVHGDEVFASLDAQLARTAQLNARAGQFLANRGRE